MLFILGTFYRFLFSCVAVILGERLARQAPDPLPLPGGIHRPGEERAAAPPAAGDGHRAAELSQGGRQAYARTQGKKKLLLRVVFRGRLTVVCVFYV